MSYQFQFTKKGKEKMTVEQVLQKSQLVMILYMSPDSGKYGTVYI